MSTPALDATIRILVVDDERPIREAYRELLASRRSRKPSEGDRLRAQLFDRPEPEPRAVNAIEFEVHTADRAEAGVEAFRAKLEAGEPFDVVFLDMRMPPGPDGAWAAAEIRALDPSIDIVISTAYSDVDPGEISARIPPVEKLFYLQKPFHAHEVRQLAIALGRKSRAEAQMRRLAYYDSLTGLANRDLMREQIHKALALAVSNGRRLATLFIDLNSFKRINDTLGHSVGDEVLRVTAVRLSSAVRSSDSLAYAGYEPARMGGDEFLLLLPEIAEVQDAGLVAERVAKALSAPIRVDGHELVISASIGIAVFPEHGGDLESLLRNADLAMYFAKRDRSAAFQYFDAAMSATALRLLTLETQLRGAIERGEFSLHYQPQVSLGTGRLTGMEALLRWRSAELGEVPPLEFIPLAEESGLINPIGDWVLHTACRQASSWLAAGLAVGRMAVNVSAVQLTQPNFVERVEHALRESALDPSALELELTESALIASYERAREVLARVRALGVQISIDDFGTGYSSLNHLKDLPVDRLKMDRSFISRIATDARELAMAAAIIAMAKSLGLRVTAEGVEDDEQLDLLESQHCDDAQGFFVARPMPAGKAEGYLRTFAFARRDEGKPS